MALRYNSINSLDRFTVLQGSSRKRPLAVGSTLLFPAKSRVIGDAYVVSTPSQK